MPDEAARKNLEAYVASLLPDVCKAPTAPVPYPVIIGTLDKSIRTETTVRFTSNEAFHAMSRVMVVTGDEAGVGGGVKSMKNMGYCVPTEWSSHVRTKGNWLVMHDVEFEMNCLTPDSPIGNTKGKLIYVKCTAAAAITPAGEIVIDKPREEGESNDESQPSDSESSNGEDDANGGEQEGGGSDGDSTGKPSNEQPDESSLSDEERKELEDLRRQEAELEKEIEQLKDLAIEAGKALDPTPASDLYDMITALQAGDIGAAVVAAAFVLLSLSPWKLLKMGRGAFKLAKIMKKLSKLYDKLKAIRKKIDDHLKKVFGNNLERGSIRISLPKSLSPVWKKLKPFRGKTKTNGMKGKDRRYYEWDNTHGDIEVYDSNGRHLGSANPQTGEIYKDPVPGREIEI